MTVPALTTANGFFACLSLDGSPALAEQLALDLSLLDNLEVLHQVNSLLVKTLSAESSALVVDPIYTLDLLAAKSTHSAALIRLEQNKEFLPTQMPELWPDFSLEEIKNNYAAAKLSLFYHPKEEQALAKKQLLAEIKDYCRTLGIAFLLELKIYDPAKFQAAPTKAKLSVEAPSATAESAATESEQLFSFQQAQLAAVEELRNLADLFVLEYPGDALSVATLSTGLDVPWLISNSGQMNYDNFKEIFREVMDNGAKGYLLGNLLWQELADYRSAEGLDLAAIEKYLQTTVRDRLLELNRIVSEAMATDKA